MARLQDDRRRKAIVFGAGGGIGSAAVRLLRDGPDRWEVEALGRDSVPHIDFTDEASLEDAAAALAERGPFELMLDATGVLHDDQLSPEKSLRAVSQKAMARAFLINAIGPALLLRYFSPLLPKDRRSVFGTLSARVGSIGDNRLGGWYSYRASKAALNMIVRTAAIELARTRPQAIVVALHPGTVRTGLSAPFAGSRPTLSPAAAATSLVAVMADCGSGDSGRFLAYDGAPIPW